MRPCKRSKNDAIHVVNNTREASITVERGESSCYSVIPAYAILSSSKLHRELSKVWDEYKIEKINLKLHFIDNTGIGNAASRYFQLYTVWDDNETSANIKYTELATYETFKQTAFAALATNQSPFHITSFTPKGGYTSTKKTPNNGSFVYGIYSKNTFEQRHEFLLSIQFTFTVCYRGSRFDNSWVSTKIPLDFSEINAPVVRTVQVPVPVPTQWLIDTIVIYLSLDGALPDLETTTPPFTWLPIGSATIRVPADRGAVTIERPLDGNNDDDDDYYVIRTIGPNNNIYNHSYYFTFPVPVGQYPSMTKFYSNGRLIVSDKSAHITMDKDLIKFVNLPNLT